jgi:hypothetical protein
MEKETVLIVTCQSDHTLTEMALKYLIQDNKENCFTVILMEDADIRMSHIRNNESTNIINSHIINGLTNKLVLISKTCKQIMTVKEHQSIMKQAVNTLKSLYSEVSVEGVLVSESNCIKIIQ